MWCHLLTLLLLLPALLIGVYQGLLALVGLCCRRSPRLPRPRTFRRFAIVIPAHDEEAALPRVLRACAELDYPAGRYDVFVVADNCTDRTAVVAREHGVRCLERVDPRRRGKGHALEWAIPRVLALGADAVVVLDADCTIDRHALRTFNQYLLAGQQVLQANDVTSNADAGVTGYVAAVANHLENEYFYAPKSRLGLSVFLRGTGMVFSRTVLRRHPWRAHSIVEDSAYSLTLLRGGVAIRFVESVCVRSESPMRQEHLQVQRSRWVGGNVRFALANALPLLWEGVRLRRPVLIDAGFSTVAALRSLVLAELAVTVLLAASGTVLAPGPLARVLFQTALGLAGLHVLYFVLGILSFGLSRRRLALLCLSPLGALRILTASLRGAFGAGSDTWMKTPRASS